MYNILSEAMSVPAPLPPRSPERYRNEPYKKLGDIVRSCLSDCGGTLSGAKVREIAYYIASEHLGLPPEEYGGMLTPLVGSEIWEVERFRRTGMISFS